MKNIFVGKTIDEAKMKASEAFGVPVEDITFTVLEEPKKGLFGLIKSEAKIEAEYVSGDDHLGGSSYTPRYRKRYA